MKWLEALRRWNASRGGRYTIPRKGSPEHAEVCELMEGGSRSSGYVKLLYAKHVNKMKPDDYDPEARPKKSARTFNPKKVGKPSDFLKEHAVEMEEGVAIRKEAKEAAKALPKAVVAAESKPSSPPPSGTRRILFTESGRKYEQTAEEKAADATKEKKKAEERLAYMEEYWAKQSKTDRISAYYDIEALKIAPPAKMKKGYEQWVADGRPSTYKITSTALRKNLVGNVDWERQGNKATSVRFGWNPNTKRVGYIDNGGAKPPKRHSAEETKVRPLNELFMTKPSKGLVEEQLMGKGCWWMRELDEF